MAESFEKPPEVKGRYEPLGKAELVDHDDRSLRLRAGVATVTVTALVPDLFRVGMFPEGRAPDYNSEAVAKEDWAPLTAEIRDEHAALTLSTGSATVHVGLDPLRISFVDYSGAHFAADHPELGIRPKVRNPLSYISVLC